MYNNTDVLSVLWRRNGKTIDWAGTLASLEELIKFTFRYQGCGYLTLRYGTSTWNSEHLNEHTPFFSQNGLLWLDKNLIYDRNSNGLLAMPGVLIKIDILDLILYNLNISELRIIDKLKRLC